MKTLTQRQKVFVSHKTHSVIPVTQEDIVDLLCNLITWQEEIKLCLFWQCGAPPVQVQHNS